MDRIGLALPLPNVNPNAVSGLSVITSMLTALFVYSGPPLHFLVIFFLILTIVLDWFDGLIAKKFQRTTEEGYIVDVTSDRLSEGIIFSVFFFPWFFLFVINCLLTMRSFVKGRHVIIPLRHIFLIYYIFMMITAQP